MVVAFCPRCQAARNMMESLTRWEAIDKDENTTAMVTRSYTCETCGTFVRSDDEKFTPTEEREAPRFEERHADKSEESEQEKRIGF